MGMTPYARRLRDRARKRRDARLAMEAFLRMPAMGSAEAFRIATNADAWEAAFARRAEQHRPAWEQVLRLASRMTGDEGGAT